MKISAFNVISNNDHAESKSGASEKTICVLGSARSGTSMVSGLLRIMGIHMGDNLDHANNEDMDFHKATQPLQDLVNVLRPGHMRKIKEMKQFIQEKNKREIWGWKDPQSIFYFNKIDKFLPNPLCIMIFRDPLAIAQREVNTKFFEDIPKTMTREIKRRFDQMYECIKYIQNKNYPLMLISYERALRQKLELIDELSAFIGVDLSDEKIDACKKYIRADRGSAQIDL